MQEPELLEYAADRKVLPSTPTTLIALLTAVAYGWRQQKAAERAEEIRELGTELYERPRGLASEMAVLGSQLERAVHAYNRAVGAWDTKAMPAARRLHEVGAGAADQMEQARLIDTAIRPPKP